MPHVATSQKGHKGGEGGHCFFTDLIGRLTWLNTLTVYIYFKYRLF